jgi:hypothetical protein
MSFEEYPKAIYKGDSLLIVQNKQEEDAATGYGAWVNPFERAAESQEAEEQPNSTATPLTPDDSAPDAPRRPGRPRKASE